MKRWLYQYRESDVSDPAGWVKQVKTKTRHPLSLRELLRSKEESACGIMMLDYPEEKLKFLCDSTRDEGISITLICSRFYDERTLFMLRKFKNVSMYPTASLLKSLVSSCGGTSVNAQAVYLDLPPEKELFDLFRESMTRVLITEDKNLLPLIAENGFFSLNALTTDDEPTETVSTEIHLNKTPLFTSYPLAPRVSMLRSMEELLAAVFIRHYDPADRRYVLQGSFPYLCEEQISFPQNPVAFCQEKILENKGILLREESRDLLFLYGVHGETGCFMAMDSQWKPVLLSKNSLQCFSGENTSLSLLCYVPSRQIPRSSLLSEALREEDKDKPPYHGRMAAVRFLNDITFAGASVDRISLQIFLEERLLLGEALKWFASQKELYVEHLEAYLTMLEKDAASILRQVRESSKERYPSLPLQWQNSLQRIFTAEEVCLTECVDDLRRMDTYLQWAKELRKKS